MNFETIDYSLSPRITSTLDQKIPRVIYQTFKSNTVSTVLYSGVKSVIELNPEYRYEFYDDQRMIDFVRNFDCSDFSFDSRALIKAFDDIQPGAGKADIWRYLIIYQFGGVYLDLDVKCLKPLSSMIDSSADIVTNIAGKSYNYDDHINHWVHLFPQWYLMYAPKCSVMKDIIEVCIQAITTRTPIPNSETCLNMLERYTGVCASNYVYRNIFNFRSLEQEARFKPGNYKIKHGINSYDISVLPSTPSIVNNTLKNKHFNDVEDHRKELVNNSNDHWLYQHVFANE